MILGLALLLSTFSAFATALERAEMVCAKENTEIYQDDCYWILKKAFYFDAMAVELCENMAYDNFRNDCLIMARNKKYDLASLKECSKMTSLNGILNDSNALYCIYKTPFKNFWKNQN